MCKRREDWNDLLSAAKKHKGEKFSHRSFSSHIVYPVITVVTLRVCKCVCMFVDAQARVNRIMSASSESQQFDTLFFPFSLQFDGWCLSSELSLLTTHSSHTPRQSLCLTFRIKCLFSAGCVVVCAKARERVFIVERWWESTLDMENLLLQTLLMAH